MHDNPRSFGSVAESLATTPVIIFGEPGRGKSTITHVLRLLETTRQETWRAERALAAWLVADAGAGKTLLWSPAIPSLRGRGWMLRAVRRPGYVFRNQSDAAPLREFHAVPYLRTGNKLCQQPSAGLAEFANAGRFLALDQAERELRTSLPPRESATRDRWQRIARRLLLKDAAGRRLYQNSARARRAALEALCPRWWRQSYPPPSRIAAQFRTALVGTLTRTAPPLVASASGMVPGQPSPSY
ncbi:hypothetical protein ABH920_003513 [Catenulispora sp. EB89]